MGILDTYYSFLDTIKQYNDSIQEKNDRINNLYNQYMDLLNNKREEGRKQIDALNDLHRTISAYIKIAKSHISVLPKVDIPKAINMDRLTQLSIQINERAQNDPYAVELYKEAKSQEINLDRRYLVINAECDSQIKQLVNEHNSKKAEIEQQRDAIVQKLKSFIDTHEVVKKLYHGLEKNRSVYSSFTDDADIQEYSNCLCIGNYNELLPIPTDCGMIMKRELKEFYDVPSNSIFLPTYIPMQSGIYHFEYSGRTEETLLGGIQNLILNLAKYYSKDYNQVIFCDPIRYNASALGILGEFTLGRNSYIEHVPTSETEMTDLLTKLTLSLGQADTSDSNRQLSGKVVVFHGFPDGYSSGNLNKIKQICANAKHYNILVILMTPTTQKGKTANEILNEVGIASNVFIECCNEKFEVYFGKDGQNRKIFSWYSAPKVIPPDVRNRYINNNPPQNLNNDFDSRVGFNKGKVTYEKGIRYLDDIPMGIDEDGNVVKIDFENSNFATFICGAARSGKSTLLHTIITSIIQKMHPDDVEIWLIDFKMTEFSKYIKFCPPHIRYIMLDESPELVYDIIDRLTEILQKRQNIFKGKWQKLYEVPKEKYMPAILVIIDEFSVMSQIITDSVVNSTENYKAKMQALLAKGAALGLHFIFSSQGFTSGTQGLTDFSKKQIQQRIAMKTEYAEIKETLDLKSISNDDQAMMEQLTVHHALIRVPTDQYGNHLLLSKVIRLSDYAKQEMLIANINQSLSTVSKFDCDDPMVYIDKQTMVIDGNSYLPFDSKINEMKKNMEGERDIDDEVFLYIGEPRRMKPVFPIIVSKSFCENIMIIAPSRENMSVCSIILSIAESLKLQGKSIFMWASHKNVIFNQLYRKCSRADFIYSRGIEGICDAIRVLKQRILNKEESNEFYFLVGFDALLVDMTYLQNSNFEEGDSDKTQMDKGGNGQYSLIHGREEGELDLLAQMNEGIESNNRAIWDKLRNVVEQKEDQNVLKQNEAITLDEDLSVYDARKDLKFILEQGPRLGYHFIMVFDTVEGLEQNKIDTMLFKHKITFRDSRANAVRFIGSQLAASVSELDDHCFRYSDGIETCSFRPYLHKGLTWDEWMLDDNGNPIQASQDEVYLL